jgi:hypothetical protein
MRAWSDAPDPGDDFNCRCWAEPVELTEDVKQALKVAYKHLNDFKEDKYTLSVKFLEHYLGNTGSKVILPEDIFDRNPVVQSAIKKNQERFQGNWNLSPTSFLRPLHLKITGMLILTRKIFWRA